VSEAPAAGARFPLPPVPDGWYRAVYSDELAVGEVKPLAILGRDLVVWRGADARVRVADAHCPHLGAHLGVGGRVEENDIVCPFHAWRWSGDTGRCVEIPYAKRIPQQACIRTWTVREQNGYAMLWYHAAGGPPWFDVPQIPETSDPAYRIYKRMRWLLDSHIQDIYENVVDVQHFRSVHAMDVERSIWEPVGGAESPIVRLSVAMRRESEAQSGAGGKTEIESFMYGPGLQVTRLSGKLSGASVNSLTPLGADKVEVSHTYYVKAADAAAEKEIEAFWDYYVDDHRLDFQIWNHKAYRERPVLAEGDGDVSGFRRWFRLFYSGESAPNTKRADAA
jgi:phenylpropionate dioxygenase-like ring-hydroxylating dioxygenase large terminal subunit